jgi:hypothetical protein
MFLPRLNKEVSPAIARFTKLTAKRWLHPVVARMSAEFYDKIARGISKDKALYAKEYSELFHWWQRNDLPSMVKNIFFANACIFKICAATFVACSFTGALIKKGGGTGPVMP